VIDRDGYSIHADIFTRTEMDDVRRALDAASLQRSRAGARHILAVPAVHAIARDARLLDLAHPVVGATAFPYRATLFDKSPSANWLVAWHQDVALPVVRQVTHPAWGPWSRKGGVLHAVAPASALERVVALRVHLDGSTAANGPLRLLPGTHTRGVLDGDEVCRLGGALEHVVCTVTAGGVIALRPLTVHASSKSVSEQPRRVLHIEYAAAADLGDGVTLAVA
jgi:ectoine hydroxylase-related dioxygenase (phytanoyl-CoA dioxygenase family)